MPERNTSLTPDVPLTVEFPAAFIQIFYRALIEGPLTEAIGSAMSGLLSLLGIPGHPVVRSELRDGATAPFGLRVNGRRCRYADDFFRQVHGSFNRRHPSPDIDDQRVCDWLLELAASESGKFIEFVAIACEEILKLRPSLLLSLAQAEAYHQLLLSHWPKAPGSDSLHRLLAEVLDLGLSLVDTAKVAAMLQDADEQRLGHDETIEVLIASLQPDEVEIRIAPGYLRALTETAEELEKGPFSVMRDDLFFELGIVFPDLRFVTDEHLPPASFAFKLNHLVTLPRVGLGVGEALANEEPAQLRMIGIESVTAAAHPVAHRVASVVCAEDAVAAEREGITTCNSLGFLVLCLSAHLRGHAAALLRQDVVRRALDQLQIPLPALIEAVRERLSVARLMRVLRELLAEEVSIRDMRLLLEAILGCDYVLADESELIVFDERITCRTPPLMECRNDAVVLAKCVRRAFKRYLSYKYTRGQSTMISYLLDPAIEKKLANHVNGAVPLSEADIESIVASTQSQIKPFEASMPPTVLTTTEARRPFRQLIQPVYPWLPVIAYQELSPDKNIQPITRISLAN